MNDKNVRTTLTELKNWGSECLQMEGRCLIEAAERVDERFASACQLILECSGRVVTTGIGKSGHIARKVASTLASTGTPALYLHPSEALHGDLGMISAGDCLLAIAYGGETAEVCRVAEFARRNGNKVISITGKSQSSLAQLSDVCLDGSVREEACPLNLAPTASSTLALALGDALSISVMRAKGFGSTDFATFHPGGALGKRLLLVKDVMRSLDEIPVVEPDADFSLVLDRLTSRNFGVVAVCKDHELRGVITDGDLRRALKKLSTQILQNKAQSLMNVDPKVIGQDTLALDALKIMEEYKITSLFVTAGKSSKNALQGLIRMHDLIDAKIV